MKSDRVFKEGDIVRHFKRETVEKDSDKYIYIIVGIAKHTEKDEKFMIYRALYKDKDTGENFKLYARPYEEFMGKVDKSKYPNIKQKYRFELHNDTENG